MTSALLASTFVSRDIHQNSVKALLHFDGADGATTTTDNSSSAHTVTLANSAQLDDAQKQFGPTSCLFINASQSYAQLPGSSDWNFGTGDFTVEFWARKSANGANGIYRRILQLRDGDTFSGFSLADNRATNGQLSFSASTNGTSWNVAGANDAACGTWALDTQTHFAIVQTSGTLKLFVAGVQALSVTPGAALAWNAAWQPTLGGQTGVNRTLAGWIDEFRVTKGVARYTANFLVPTLPFGNF